ncbi:hypothetical protein ARMSODRAFT_981519 [Armillaria solidipes]|uniref:Uncharacterized protein n=1 Tax=Armillaria solidipes TaxID=1076256 RepID=A0A2H3BC01_9AGAR|nr:hypothetical protein ARMSODRAFT_981519 [Armillaria solidipes]
MPNVSSLAILYDTVHVSAGEQRISYGRAQAEVADLKERGPPPHRINIARDFIRISCGVNLDEDSPRSIAWLLFNVGCGEDLLIDAGNRTLFLRRAPHLGFHRRLPWVLNRNYPEVDILKNSTKYIQSRRSPGIVYPRSETRIDIGNRTLPSELNESQLLSCISTKDNVATYIKIKIPRIAMQIEIWGIEPQHRNTAAQSHIHRHGTITRGEICVQLSRHVYGILTCGLEPKDREDIVGFPRLIHDHRATAHVQIQNDRAWLGFHSRAHKVDKNRAIPSALQEMI